MKFLFPIYLAITCNLASADSCEAILKKAQEEQALIPGYQAMHTISGKTRAYFHSAPANTCINKQLFLVPGDSVVAYADYQEFTSVLYIHPKTGVETEGWVLTQRLKATGTGIAPQQH
ncbi:MAG TPA: hypothetical protein PK011_02650 [Marinagarivorans sp.]|nr:hypothetical protein [Cellvibrionaceae bacterium]HMY38200.1 hypothetical protein [Marinagarivorans sp.]